MLNSNIASNLENKRAFAIRHNLYTEFQNLKAMDRRNWIYSGKEKNVFGNIVVTGDPIETAVHKYSQAQGVNSRKRPIDFEFIVNPVIIYTLL